MGDLRFAWRALRKHPGFAAVAIITLTIAVGAATTVFSVLNAVALRPLPYADADRLVVIRDSLMPKLPEFSVSPGRFAEWQARTRAFEGVAAARGTVVNLTGAGDPQRLRVAVVSANFFDLLGVPALAGRAFSAGDDADAASGDRIVLSEAVWRGQFGAAPGVIGRTVLIDDHPTTVIGVMPDRLAYPSATTQAWLLWRMTPQERTTYGSHYLVCFARMKPGVTVEQARADLARASRDIEPIDRGNLGWTTLLWPMLEFAVRNVRSGLWVLSGAVALVLLIACANVANLLLARGIGRSRELGVRAAMGATRGRLARQMFLENALLGVLGSAGGLALAWALLAFVADAPTGLPRASTIHLDGPTLICALALAILTPIIFGLVPTLHVSRANLSALAAQGGRSAASALGARTRAGLIIAEVALAVMLVAGSTLLVRSFARLVNVSPGFEPDHVLTLVLSLPSSRYPDDERRDRFWTTLVERVSSLPGVQHAGITQSLPFVSDYVASLTIPGKTSDDPTIQPSTNFYAVNPDYFAAMGIPLLRGHAPTLADGPGLPLVAVISKSLADRYFPQEDPIGQRVKVSQGPRDEFAEVIGVAGDVKQYGLDVDTTLQVYHAARQHPYFGAMNLVIRTSSDPEAMSAALRTTVRDLDPLLPIATPRTLSSIVASSVGPRRFTTTLLAGFAVVALVLSAIGVYGLVAFSVGQRAQEIGVRMALGSTPGGIMRLVFRQGLALTLAGAVVGVIAGLFGAELLGSLLFDVSRHDPLAFVVAPVVLLAAAALACYVPARRAVRVDPVAALRAQ
ncbi:MAG TPA: ABC transporter permease [Vicinamibacterales bacterium]|nr:ABC transporter permease [Vicinamibacterales bacterium]